MTVPFGDDRSNASFEDGRSSASLDDERTSASLDDDRTTVPFEKYHGTGNDFLLVDAEAGVSDRGALAARECDRQTGVGADGILFLGLEPQFTPPRVVMTLVQPDGATAPMCGNGARCAAEWAMRKTGSDAVMIDTQAGTRRAERADGAIAVEMGAPSFDPADVPLASDREAPLLEEPIEGLSLTAVDTGVPHAVAFVDDVDTVDLEAVAPPVRHADAFPRGANVTLASPASNGEENSDDGPGSNGEAAVDGRAFRQRTYERGVEGETDACGTGAVAIAAAARRLGRVGPDETPVTVTPPGGPLQVRFDARGRTILLGPVEREFGGEVRVARPVTER